MAGFGKPKAATILQRQKMAELINLARVYRNWSVDDAVQILEIRKVMFVDEKSGWVVTKLDLDLMEISFVCNIAKALDWPIERVVEFLMAREK